MTTKILIDGMLNGTGIRDAKKGGFIDPKSLGLSGQLLLSLNSWQAQYEEAHFDGYPDNLVRKLDEDGVALTLKIRESLTGLEVGYFSNGLMKRLD